MSNSNADLVVPELGINQPRERALLAHYDAHIGARSPVLTCLRDGAFHLDVFLFEPTAERPFITLATVGMSFRSMNAPIGGDDPMDRVELLMYLAPDWDFDAPIGTTPIESLALSARYPWQHDTSLLLGDSIAPGDRPVVPGSVLTATFFTWPPEDDDFQHLQFTDGTVCHFLWEVHITDAELYVKLEEGAQALRDRLDEAGYRALDVDRACLISTENRQQRRAREKALRARARLPRARTFQQINCQLHDHAGHER